VTGPIGDPCLRATVGQLHRDEGRPEIVEPDPQPQGAVLEQLRAIDAGAHQMIAEALRSVVPA